MKKILTLATMAFLLINEGHSQFSRYIIQFKDKGATTLSLSNPSTFLSQRAIERRTRYTIAIDSTDLPVPATYLQQIKNIPGVTILNTSRWLNAISIQTTDPAAITSINALSFVLSSNPIAARSAETIIRKHTETTSSVPFAVAAKQQQLQADYFNYGGNSFNEIHLHQGEFLHNAGLRGQSMQIAVLDAGFFNYTGLRAFDSVNSNGQVLSTWDFVNREASVAEDNAHGMQCFSIIAANIPGEFIGKAPKASFHLFRTEDAFSEYPIEEFNWACGAERADSTGADIISSSLGYGYQFSGGWPDYPYSNLNGDITLSARAADLAAKKGLLVFNAAGNSGNDYWKKITTPADGDSVVAVGAVNTAGVVGTFSSYGPSADGRIKPDIASVGVAAMVQATNNTIGVSNGTSFACPNIAGLGACLWQGFPEFNNMRIVRALKEAGSIYAAPNDRIGYGIPNLKTAFTTLLKEFATGSATLSPCAATLVWTSKDVQSMRYDIERKTSSDLNYIKIATVNPLPGVVLTNHQYQFQQDLEGLAAGTISYRIRQVVDTATAGLTAIYIEIPPVTLATGCLAPGNGKIMLAPNPTTGNSKLVIQTEQAISNMQVIIYDMRGNTVSQFNQSKPAGVFAMELPASRLAPGKYIVKAYDGRTKIGQAELLKL